MLRKVCVVSRGKPATIGLSSRKVWTHRFVAMSRASDAKLEEYCLVAKGSKGRTVADVIQRATSDPVLFAFGELLSLPSVQQVKHLRVLGNYKSGNDCSIHTVCLLTAARHRSSFQFQNTTAICLWDLGYLSRFGAIYFLAQAFLNLYCKTFWYRSSRPLPTPEHSAAT